MNNKVLEYIIRAKDATADAVKSALSRVRSFASAAGAQLANIKAGFDMLARVAQSFASVFAAAIKEAFSFEKAVSDFKVLLGSVDEAKAHIEELRRFAAATPLTFGDLSKASKLLLSFGASVDEVMPAMKMLGDISMGDAQKFQSLALVFAQVKSAGKLMGQDLLQMINQGFNPLTVIAQQTGKSMAELKDMMADGAISFEMVAEAMRVATAEGGLFGGAMDEASKTGEGLVSTLRDKWTDAVRGFGEAFSDSAKGGIQEIIDKLTELVESGAVEGFAEQVAKAIDGISAAAKGCSAVFGGLWKAVKGGFEAAGQAAGGFVGALAGGGGIGDALSEGMSGLRQGWTDAWDSDGAEAAMRIRRANARKAGRTTSTSAPPAETGGGRTLSEMLADAEAQGREEEERLAEKRRKEAERLANEIAKEEERLRVEAERAIAAERDRLQRKTLEEYRNGLETARAAESDAQSRLAAAQAAERQAWGWYRDRDSWKAQLEEERADAKAQKQFEKDFERLRFRRDWRTAELSDDDEVVRRVALTREQERAAEDYARQTAEATQVAADMLESIEQMLSEGGDE